MIGSNWSAFASSSQKGPVLYEIKRHFTEHMLLAPAYVSENTFRRIISVAKSEEDLQQEVWAAAEIYEDALKRYRAGDREDRKEHHLLGPSLHGRMDHVRWPGRPDPRDHVPFQFQRMSAQQPSPLCDEGYDGSQRDRLRCRDRLSPHRRAPVLLGRPVQPRQALPAIAQGLPT